MAQSALKTLPKSEKLVFQKPRLIPLMLFVALIFGISLFFVWSRIQVFQFEYAISSLESELREGGQENRKLRLEVASLRNPSRIERLARNELGLRLPDPAQIISVR